MPQPFWLKHFVQTTLCTHVAMAMHGFGQSWCLQCRKAGGCWCRDGGDKGIPEDGGRYFLKNPGTTYAKWACEVCGKEAKEGHLDSDYHYRKLANANVKLPDDILYRIGYKTRPTDQLALAPPPPGLGSAAGAAGSTWGTSEDRELQQMRSKMKEMEQRMAEMFSKMQEMQEMEQQMRSKMQEMEHLMICKMQEMEQQINGVVAVMTSASKSGTVQT